jgi:hypothetical protein
MLAELVFGPFGPTIQWILSAWEAWHNKTNPQKQIFVWLGGAVQVGYPEVLSSKEKAVQMS